jgi:hypothetical protein
MENVLVAGVSLSVSILHPTFVDFLKKKKKKKTHFDFERSLIARPVALTTSGVILICK